MSDDQNLDDLIMSLATGNWQKTAKIIGFALIQLEASPSDNPADKVAKRIEHLVSVNRLESQGDLSRWRFSEVRLPTSPE